MKCILVVFPYEHNEGDRMLPAGDMLKKGFCVCCLSRRRGFFLEYSPINYGTAWPCPVPEQGRL